MVVVLPAKNGNAPQTPQPIAPRKKSLKNNEEKKKENVFMNVVIKKLLL